jgi:hypothetical protein
VLGTVVAIVAFGITYGKTVDPLTAIGAVGLAYMALTPLVFLVLVFRGAVELYGPSESRLLLLGSAVFYWGLLAWYLLVKHWGLHSYAFLLLGGLTLLLGPPCLVRLAILRYRDRYKPCPECGNDVLKIARVCQYCRYRWQPPLSSPTSTEV